MVCGNEHNYKDGMLLRCIKRKNHKGYCEARITVNWYKIKGSE